MDSHLRVRRSHRTQARRARCKGANPAKSAQVWAAAVGVQAAAQQPRIEELLRAQEAFEEELFAALLGELGLPEHLLAGALLWSEPL